MHGGIIMGVELRALREPHPRSQHRPDGEPEHGVVPARPGMSDIPKIDVTLMNQPERGVIGIGEPPTISTAAAIANAVAQRDRRARAGACRSRPTAVLAALPTQRTRRRDAVKAFAYVNAANEKEAVAALGDRARQGAAARRRHGPARADEGLHRAARRARQRQEPAVSTIAVPRAGRTARSARRRRSSRSSSTPTLGDAYPALVRGGRRSRHAADPQRRHRRRQPRCSGRAAGTSGTRSSHCLKKGGARCFAVDGENQFHAIFGDGPCHIVHPSSLARAGRSRYGARFRVVGPAGEREVDGRRVLRHARSQHVRRDGARAERAR